MKLETQVNEKTPSTVPLKGHLDKSTPEKKITGSTDCSTVVAKAFQGTALHTEIKFSKDSSTTALLRNCQLTQAVVSVPKALDGASYSHTFQLLTMLALTSRNVLLASGIR